MDETYMTRSEIAKALGITEDAVKALLYRAVRKIREQHPELREWITEEAA
jgi:DNA-directed RNA polymerase specialized sigma24 family protein